MTVRDALVAARALIDTPDKWCKLQMHSFNRERHCIVGACAQVAGFESDALKVLEAMVPRTRTNSQRPLAFFNDAKTTTHADILALFDRAIAASA